MTLEAFEQSRGFEQGTDGRSGTRDFLVVENDSTITTQPSMDQVIRSTGVRLYVPDSTPVLGNLIPLSVSVRTAGDKQIQYLVSFKYGLETVGSDDTTDDPSAPSFVAFNISQRPVAFDLYRADDFEFPVDRFADIKGTPVDNAGEPITAFIIQQDLEIQVRYEKFADVPNLDSLSLVAKRNSTKFLGAEPGMLHYSGMSLTRDGINSYNASFTFVWDQFKHQRQSPLRDQNGDVVVILDPDRPASEKHFIAETVMMKQPFPDLGDFALLGLPDPV
jgi:hypothetical protein